MYYRVAFRVDQNVVEKAVVGPQCEHVVDQSPTWKWRSTLLTSPHALFTLLRAYSYVPKDQIRVFFASSEDDMDEMLTRQNQGQISSSITADQFLSGKSINTLDVKRLEWELSTEPDQDESYTFTMPTNVHEMGAWTQLMLKVRNGELES